MPLPYYVEPEYWIEGYAEGDAITAKATELQAAYDAKAYARSRATAYPTIQPAE
jgi:hypothetical protein